MTFASYTGTGTYPALRAGEDYYNVYVDDVVLEKIPDCAKIAEAEVTPSSDKAVVKIDGNEDNTYNLYYRKKGETSWSEDAVEFEDGEATIEELVPATTYEFYVQTDCGDDNTIDSKTFGFTTACVALTEEDLPKKWDFETGNTAGTTSYPLPVCWVRQDSQYPYVYNDSYGGGYTKSGTYCLRFYGNDKTTVALTPVDADEIDINKLQLSLWARGSNYSTLTLEAGVMTNPSDASTFVKTASVDLTGTYTEYELTFASYTGTGTYPALRFSGNGDWATIYVDDVTLEKIPACAKIQSATVAATATTATVKITGVEDTDYKFYYRKKGETSWSDAIDFEDGEVEIEELTAATTYEYYVETVCDEDENAVSSTFTFKTECATVTVTDETNYFEGFDVIGDLGCWTISKTGNAKWEVLNELYMGTWVYPYHGNGFAAVEYTSGEVLLISPVFDISDVTTPMVEYHYYVGGYEGDIDELTVMYRTSATDTWKTLKTYTASTSAWKYDSILLTDASETYQIAFKYVENGGYGVGIDSLVVRNSSADAPAVCAKPTSLAVTDITETGAKLTWSGDAESYDVKLGENGTSTNVTTASYTFTNLTSGTQYTAYVRANCEDIDDPSAWASINFTTEEETVTCDKPTALTIVDSTETTVKISWTGTASKYSVQRDNETAVEVTTNSYEFTNLTAGSTYSVKVKSICGENSESDWSDALTIKTKAATPAPCDKPTALTIVDSTETTVKISWTGTASKYSVQRDNETAVEVTTNSYEFTNLTAGSTYSVKVKSICGENSESDWSDALTIKTKAATPAPCDKPTALTIVDSTETTVKISWTGTASKYSVQRDNETAVEVTTNSYEFTNLTAGSTYSVKVKSICGENSESDWSDALTIKTKAATPAPCDKPTALTIVDSTETTVKISWTGTASKYSVQRDNETAVEVTTNSYEFTNLTAGSTYSVKVKSICGENSESDWSDALTITTKTAEEPCEATAETITAAICDGGMFTMNGEAYTQAGTYTQTLTNACGADSVLTINLTVNPTYAETVTETIQKGESYTFNGQTYTQSGTYTVTLESEAGCDSVVTLELIVDENGLTDATGALHVSMYPNPATTQAVLSIEGLTSEAEIILSDVSGRIIRRNTLPTGQKTMTIETESLSKGTYYIRIVSEGMIRTEKLIKQ